MKLNKQRKLEIKMRNKPLWQLNAQIKKVREEKGLSVEEFARTLSLRLEVVEAIENYDSFWQFKTAVSILRKFGKTLKIDVVDK